MRLIRTRLLSLNVSFVSDYFQSTICLLLSLCQFSLGSFNFSLNLELFYTMKKLEKINSKQMYIHNNICFN